MLPLAKNIKRCLKYKHIFIVLLVIIFSVSIGFISYKYLTKEVVIYGDGKTIITKTIKGTVKDVLMQCKVEVKQYDYISIPLSTKLQKTKINEIHIKRAVPVHVTADGREIRLMTYRNTVGDALKNCSIKLSGMDKLSGAKLEDSIVPGMKVKVIRVKESVVAEKSPVEFKTITRENDRLDKGVQQVIREGKVGTREKSFKIILEDGKEVARHLVKDTIIGNPLDAIVEIGTVISYKTSRGDMIRYNKVIDMSATAYTSSYVDTGKSPGDKGFGITCTGMKARRGVIAVDPSVIPLGTRVYVETAGRIADYGYAVAGDIGGAIKGNIIDLYYEDGSMVKNWGRRKVKVYILQR